MKNIIYVSDSKFDKMSKKQRLSMPMVSDYGEVEINKLVLIPTNKKSGGWHLGDFFAYTENKGWWRPTTYDCWQITTEIENSIKIRYQILKGDFEYGGINIFGFVDEHCKAYISYGGHITIRKNEKTP